MELVQARKDQAAACYQCIEDGRAYQRAQGFVQWGPNYPCMQTITDDINAGVGYAFTEGGEVIGYVALIAGDEPAYHDIDGAWKTERPYATVHRMAFGSNARGGGLSKAAFALIKEHCLQAGIRAIRADTQGENKVMQHVLAREGFSPCGTITFDGGPKLAYEWDA